MRAAVFVGFEFWRARILSLSKRDEKHSPAVKLLDGFAWKKGTRQAFRFLRGSSIDQMWDLSLYAVRPEFFTSESIATYSRPPEAPFFVEKLRITAWNSMEFLIHYILFASLFLSTSYNRPSSLELVMSWQ